VQRLHPITNRAAHGLFERLRDRTHTRGPGHANDSPSQRATENYGIEQEHLNQIFGARLHITGLRAERGPGIEFLEYITPPGGRALSGDAKANDLIFWHTHLAVDDMAELSAKLHESGVASVSKPGSARSQIVRDPDGRDATR
jgi:hypothetical protein